MANEVAIREPMALTPAEVVENATTQAKLLMDIVEKTKCYQDISGKKYLQVEAWETIGAFNRTHAETESIAPILKDGEIIGYTARVQLWKDGEVVGGAYMPCYFTENCCKGKEGDAKHKSAMSASQTFATSKAYRMNYAHVAILAGYQPLPAEEVTEDMRQSAQPYTEEHWCKKHNTKFFKTPKMKTWAHPVKNEDGSPTLDDNGKQIWCSEKAEQPQAKTAVAEPGPEEKPEPPQQPTETVLHPSDGESKADGRGKGNEPLVFDMKGLKSDLEKLETAGLKAWTKTNVLSYLNVSSGKEHAKISDAFASLSDRQKRDFIEKVAETLNLAGL